MNVSEDHRWLTSPENQAPGRGVGLTAQLFGRRLPATGRSGRRRRGRQATACGTRFGGPTHAVGRQRLRSRATTASLLAACGLIVQWTINRFAVGPAAATRAFPLAAARPFGRLETRARSTALLRRATATRHQAGRHDQCERESDVNGNPEHQSDLGVTQVLGLSYESGRLLCNWCANCRTRNVLAI